MVNGFIINCDDLGMHNTVNEGIGEILAQGIIQSTSIMASGQAFEDAIQRLKSMGIDRCGAHLTLNSEYPKLPCRPVLGRAVASLCDSQGRFLADPLQSKERANTRHIKQEWLAQITKIENAGMHLTHMDGHMFCYDPAVGGKQIAGVAKAISESTGLPMRWLNSDGAGRGPITRFIWEDYDDEISRFNYYVKMLTTPLSGVEEIIVHPARDLTRLTVFTRAGERRVSDYHFFSSQLFRDIVSSNKLTILDYESARLDTTFPNVPAKEN